MRWWQIPVSPLIHLSSLNKYRLRQQKVTIFWSQVWRIGLNIRDTKNYGVSAVKWPFNLWKPSLLPGLTIKILHTAHTVYLCVLYESQNKQQVLPYTAVTDFVFYSRGGRCLLRGTNWLFKRNALLALAVNKGLIFAFHFLKLTPRNWSAWHAIHSCNRVRKLATTAPRHTTCPWSWSTLVTVEFWMPSC